jgi:hypothetical protein
MHPIMHTEFIKVRTAEQHRQVNHAGMVQAARAGRRALQPLRMPRVLAGLRTWPVAHRLAI